MEYITLGSTDLRVSRICLGTMQFAGSGDKPDTTWGSITQQEVTDTIGAVLAAGVNFIDCAEAYGGHQAERAVGLALQELGTKRSDVVLTSKFGRHAALWETDDPTGGPYVPGEFLYTAEGVQTALSESLKALQTDYIDLYQIHWPGNCGLLGKPGQLDTELSHAREVVAALEQAKAAGRIKHYGFCNFGTDDMKWFEEAGGVGVSNQLPYNLLWRSIERGILPACRKKGLAVLCYSSLQQGLLAGRYTDPAQLESGRLRTRMFEPSRSPLSRHGSPGLEGEIFGPDGALAALKGASDTAGVTMAEAAVGWLLAQPGVDIVIVGAASVSQAARNAAPLPAAATAPETIAACTAATAQLLAAVDAQGCWVDQYAAESRIHGNEPVNEEKAP